VDGRSSKSACHTQRVPCTHTHTHTHTHTPPTHTHLPAAARP
jgi:hypothetical protein